MMEKIIFFLIIGVSTMTGAIYTTNEECPENEEYLLCGSACPFNCTDPDETVTCSDDCVEGCFCKSGFLRHDNGTCVGADQCLGNFSICGEKEEFLACGTACPLTCSQPEPSVCGLACSMGCFCKSGYVRDVSTNQCVTLDQCPVEQCLNQNEVYDTCNASCEPSCEDPFPICAKLCSSGCVCAPGYLRNGQDGCVTADKCPVGNATDPGLLGKYLNAISRVLHLSIQ